MVLFQINKEVIRIAFISKRTVIIRLIHIEGRTDTVRLDFVTRPHIAQQRLRQLLLLQALLFFALFDPINKFAVKYINTR